ncbi:MAG TPA: response regulator [Candidatus Kapabacteria bacterium]|nr:response regulator [Candidatus Kapabacteria bacterium]
MALPRILIVDDEIIIARELEARLVKMGFEVPAIASSGPEAIEFAASMEPNLVLMDIVLKGEMDGIEAADVIRRSHNIPIIYLTAYTDRKTLDRAKVTEPFGYIVKPFSERELFANIEMALYKHRAESRMRKVERWFLAAINEIGDAVIAADSDDVITIFNAAAETITEWTKQDAVGRKLGDVVRLVSRESGEPISLDDVDEGPVVCVGEDTLLIDRSERSIPVDSMTTCIRDESGRASGSVTVLRDPAGERSGALFSLNSDVTLAATQGTTLDGMLQLCAESMVRNLRASLVRIWVVNASGDMLLLQASAGLATQVADAFAVVPVGEFDVGGIARDRLPRLINGITDGVDSPEGRWARHEGIVSFAGQPMLVDDRLVGVVGMFCRRPLQETVLDALAAVARTVAVGVERQRLMEQLRQAQKMEVIGQLAGGIAHDFNNLLTIISGYSQILLADESLSEDARSLVGHISAAGDRATGLTRQLLAFSRKQVLRLRELDLNALVGEIETLLTRLIGENVSLVIRLDPSLGPITADAGQIEQVIMNLAVNAADAMPSGGRLTIETHRAGADIGALLKDLNLASGDYVALVVSDTGTGMSPEVMAHIFEPFFTTKGPGKGTGLGLATVYGIVRQSGGHVVVDSQPDQGTSFTIYLPCAGSGGRPVEPEPERKPLPGGNETILLVEDEEGVRSLARRILRQCGYTVLDAGTGEEAMRLCVAHDGAIHLLLTDVVLPEAGGRQVAERLAIDRPQMKVLYMSGYTDDAVLRHGVFESEVAFLQKPFTPEALAERVRGVLDGAGVERHGSPAP